MKKTAPFVNLLLILIVGWCTNPCQAYNRKIALAIDSVDMALAKSRQVMDSRLDVIDSLRNLPYYETPRNLMELAAAYSGVNNDSAIVLYNRAHKLAKSMYDLRSSNLSAISLSEHLSRAGMYNEALTVLGNIDTALLDNELKSLYYRSLANINLEIIRHTRLQSLKDRAKADAIEAVDSLLCILPDYVPQYKVAKALDELLEGDSIVASGTMLEILDESVPGQATYTVALQLLSDYYEDNSKARDEYLYYLALASRDKLVRGDGANESLLKLGSELYKSGDLKRAYAFMDAAGSNIYQSQSCNLYGTLVPTMGEMIKAIQHHESQMRLVHLIIYLSGMTLIIILCYLLWNKHKRIAQSELDNMKLKETLVAKSQYINKLLSLCSVYVESMEDFNRLVDRKLKANQAKDLAELISSGKVLKNQSERFFDVFDKAVFNIYPDFISELNALLLPDKQFTELNPDTLSPELRIAAFMRMGINDSSRLSKFLGLSLNTIYTYRNRMKNRAADRDNFESELIKLG